MDAPVRSSQRNWFTDQVFEFASFMPWQFMLLGMTGVLLGLQLESGAAQNDSTPQLTG